MLGRIARSALLVAFFLGVLGVLAFGAVSAAKAFTHINPSSAGPITAAPTATQPPDITIRNTGAEGTVPPIPQYTLGLWVSNTSPGFGESITVYARLSNYSLPVSGQTVAFNWGGKVLSAKTDSNGIASISINASGPASQPVTISGFITIQGQKLTNQTFYTIP